MRPVKMAAILMIAQFAMSGMALSQEAGPPDRVSDPLAGWEPNFGVVIGLDFQTVEGSTSTSDIVPNPATFPGPIRPPSEGDVLNTQPTVGLDLGILSPRVVSLGDQVWLRVFAHASAELNFAAETVATREEARGALRPPVGSTGDPVDRFSEISIVGQGSRGVVDFQLYQFRAGTGLAFDIELFERPVRIRTSLEYIRKRIKPRAGVSRAIQTRLGTPPTFLVDDFENDFRFITTDVEESVTLHGIGPGIEAEVDAPKIGPFRTSIFGGFNFYRFLGDLETESTVSAGSGNPSETATFRFEFKPWVYRINAGFRIRWQPN